MTLLDRLDVALIVVGWVGAATFVVAYPIGTDVRRWTREGRHWWLVALGLVLIGVLGFIRRVWPGVEGQTPYHAAESAAIALLAFLTWQRVTLYVRARREYRASLTTPKE